MKSFLKIATLFFISANVALAAENVNSTAKSKVGASKSVVGTKANGTGKGEFARDRPALVKPDGNNVNKSADKGKINISPTHKIKPDNSAK